MALKAYFCLAYFVLIFVKISDRVKQEEDRRERSLFTHENKKISGIYLSSPDN